MTPELITVVHITDATHRKQVSFHGNWLPCGKFIDSKWDADTYRMAWAFATTANHGIVAFRYRSKPGMASASPEIGDFLARYETFDEMAPEITEAGFNPKLLSHIQDSLVWHSVEHHDAW